MSEQTPQPPKCPECGGNMSWKYQKEPRCLACAAARGRESGDAPQPPKAPTSRTTRYVYHIHGHAKLHDVKNAPGPVVPFEVVLRRPFAIDSDDTMDEVRQEVRDHVIAELDAAGSPYLVGDVMIRGVNKLHRILVEADDPQGPAVRIMS